MTSKILEHEDRLKGMPDADVIQEAQFPTGQIPQFLVISEIQRRQDMRERYASREEGQTDQTVAEQIVAGASLRPSSQGSEALQLRMPQGPSSQNPVGAVPPPQGLGPPETMVAQTAPMAPPPQMMPPAPQMMPPAPQQPPPQLTAARGGRMPYRRMAHGGMVPPNALVEDAIKFNPDSLRTADAAQIRAMANLTDMGIPTVLPMGEEEGKAGRWLRGALAGASAEGDVRWGLGGRGLAAQGGLNLPLGEKNALALGMRGHVLPFSQRKGDRFGVDALSARLGLGDNAISAEYDLPNKAWRARLNRRMGNNAISAEYDSRNNAWRAGLNRGANEWSLGVDPGQKAFELGYRRKFNQGGVVGQDGSQVPSESRYPEELNPYFFGPDPVVQVEAQARAKAVEAAQEAAEAQAREAQAAAPNAGLPPVNPMAAYEGAQEARYAKRKQYISDMIVADEKRQKKNMWSQAMIDVGAGIASGDVGSGFQKAGASVAAIEEAQRGRGQELQLELLKGGLGGVGTYKDLPASAKEVEYLFSLNPELRNLSPERLQALFFDVKRQNWELVEINGVQTVVRKVGNLFFDQNNNPVIPDAGTVTTAVPGGAGAPVDGAVVSATDEPARVLWGGVDSEGNEIRRSYKGSPIFMQSLETIEGLANVADYKEDRQLLRDLRREREEGAGTLKARLEGQIASTNRLQTTLNRMFDNADSWSVGHGSWLQGMTETDALTMATDLEQIQANLAFDRLQEMRAASPTGGALGQVSERELRLLQSAMQSINQKLSPEEFKLRLLEVKSLYSQLRDKSLQDYAYAMATTTNPGVRAEYDTQMQLYQGMLAGTIPASAADKETAQKIINEYNSILEARGTQALQSGGMVSIDSSGEDLAYLNNLRSEIAFLSGGRG